VTSEKFSTAIEAWKSDVKKKYPSQAEKLKFKSKDRGDNISAEIDGEDRSYGVFDVKTGKGYVLGEDISMKALLALSEKSKFEDQSTVVELKGEGLDMSLLKDLDAAAKLSEEVRSMKPGNGNFGWILQMDDDNPLVKKLAAALKVKDGWKLTKVGDLHAAYSSGDRLTIFEKDSDFEPDEN